MARVGHTTNVIPSVSLSLPPFVPLTKFDSALYWQGHWSIMDKTIFSLTGNLSSDWKTFLGMLYLVISTPFKFPPGFQY